MRSITALLIGPLVTAFLIAGGLGDAPAVSASPSVGSGLIQVSPSIGSSTFLGSVNGVAGSTASNLRASGLTTAVLKVLWNRAQPAPALVLDPTYLAGVRKQISQYQAAGLDITLDLGLQYPPKWALALPGAGFVDQYGHTFDASVASGEMAVDAIYNPAAQIAEATYIRLLAAALGPNTFRFVRVGGLLTGELRMPTNTDGGRTNSWWAFSSTFQASSPVPGYRPGISAYSPAADAAFLNYYLNGLVSYQQFLVTAVGTSFSGNLEVLYPSFGVRPGDVQAALAKHLNGSSVRASELAQGLNFAQLLPALSALAPSVSQRSRLIAYSTWLDGPQYSSSPQGLSPIGYISSLASPLALAVAGENTAQSGSSPAALKLSQSRVSEYHLSGMMWFATNLASGGVTAHMLGKSA
jgi:hypothetical protein